MKIQIARGVGRDLQIMDFDYRPNAHGERPMALDVLLQAQATDLPNLAYRYGCRNGLCGVCTIDINGKAKLACRTKVKTGDRLAPMRSLPVLRDLVVRRDLVNRQLFDRLPQVRPDPSKTQCDHAALHSLNRCIECYACLQECRNHAKNPPDGPYTRGNPYTFLKIQRVIVDPSATQANRQQALDLARSLGIDQYDSTKLPGCGVGINLKTEVIVPLQQACRSSTLPSSMLSAAGDSA